MTTSSGLIPADFLEIEDGRPVTLPLAQPYLLARSDNHCALLGESLACTQYHGRPNACRLYPHFVVAFDRQAARPLRSADAPLSRLVEDTLEGRLGNTLPLLLRHTECPGFTGPPLDASAWGRLFLDTALLQEAVDLPAVEPSSALR
jgi:Fe-S-cluster containining protein